MAAVRSLLLISEWGDNPFTSIPIEDAAAAWDAAGRIAAGQLVDSQPFMSAPLYLWMLATVRTLGFGLPTLFGLQILLWAGSGYLLGKYAWNFFSRTLHSAKVLPATLLCCAFFLWLPEPWMSCGRVLNSNLQILLAVFLMSELSQIKKHRLGFALGLNVLANPPFLLALLLIPIYLWRRQQTKLAINTIAIALLCIAPATIHNYSASGEFIPVSAQAGLTFAHGNNSGSNGFYHAIEGVSAERQRQNTDAIALVAQQTGISSWSGTSSFFFKQGFHWISSNIVAATTNFATKFILFFSEFGYGDVYQARLEAAAGLSSHPGPALFGGLLLWPALIGLIMLARKRQLSASEIICIGIPLITVVLFFYSPRYRMPALPVITLLATWLIYSGPRHSALLSVGLIIPFFIQSDAEQFRPNFLSKLGALHFQQGDLNKAADVYRQSFNLGNLEAGPSLGHTLRLLGDHQNAMRILSESAEQLPDSAHAQRSYAVALASAGDFKTAKLHFEKAIALEPADWEAPSGLGNVFASLGEAAKAEEAYRLSLKLNPNFASAWLNLGVLLETTRPKEALQAYRAAVGVDSQMVPALLSLASLLATCPNAELRNGREAKQILAMFGPVESLDLGILEIHAAAEAALGNWEQAIEQQSKVAKAFADRVSSPDDPALEAAHQARYALDAYRANRLRF